VRAEHIHLSDLNAGNNQKIQCQVKRIELLSDQHLVHLGVVGSEHDVIASVAPGSTFKSGEIVNANMAQVLCFDADGQRIR
jgi:multiple sugar transport system ATP-binding protein